MAILQQQASDVRTQEINLSQVITSASSAVACQVVVSSQGDPNPKFFTNADAYLAEYGNPNASVSFDVYCGLDFFKEGNEMWARRAVHSDALYAGALLYDDGTGSASDLAPITAGVSDVEDPDWSDLVLDPGDDPIALFYPIHGQGSYGNNISVSIDSNNVETPDNLAIVDATTGGSMTAGDYEYKVSAIGPKGETLASASELITITGILTTHVLTLTWDPVPLAYGYRIYGRTDGDPLGLIAEVGQGTYTFADVGTITPDTDVAPITDPGDLTWTPDLSFTVKVFDSSVSSEAVETFVCTLEHATDDTGMDSELEARINPFSQYIQVASNVPGLVTVPTVTSVAKTALEGGDSGTAPTSFDVAAAYDVFKNKQLYAVNILINSGHADPVVQLAMDTLVQTRGDAVALLDLPSSSQEFQAAVNYRNLTLNLNSSYSALFGPDVLEADNINGKQQYVPFSGWAAALCARTDRVANPSFSIAGLNRGLVNVLKSRVSYDDGEATQLFKAQVNYTRTFIGQGIALWEQQTLSGQTSALSWLSVRRIVNVIKTSVYKFLLYSLQEPNDDFTGRQIVGSISTYLEVLKNARAISDFTVVSDASNNTAAQFNSGIRNVTVIIIPMIPIHEIDLIIGISKQGVSFQEVLKQVGGQ